MPSNSKAYNQYYGKYLECCTVAALNNEPIHYEENYTFTDEETAEFMVEANEIADYLGREHIAIYEGNKTSTASGDILLDGKQNIEIKRVSAGTGTYFNTTVYYLDDKFHFNFKDYMKQYGLIEALQENFGHVVKVKEANKSPISQKDSSMIRHSDELSSIWEEKILPIDEQVRQHFVADLVEYFRNNPDKVYEFVNDMLTKGTKCDKTQPDRLIVYNYTKHFMFELDLNNMINTISNHIRSTAEGFVIGNVRFQIGWQNGNGLNNPTIRVFLDEKEKV